MACCRAALLSHADGDRPAARAARSANAHASASSDRAFFTVAIPVTVPSVRQIASLAWTAPPPGRVLDRPADLSDSGSSPGAEMLAHPAMRGAQISQRRATGMYSAAIVPEYDADASSSDPPAGSGPVRSGETAGSARSAPQPRHCVGASAVPVQSDTAARHQARPLMPVLASRLAVPGWLP